MHNGLQRPGARGGVSQIAGPQAATPVATGGGAARVALNPEGHIAHRAAPTRPPLTLVMTASRMRHAPPSKLEHTSG